MVTDVEFAVVGAGMAGTATARALARRGREVVLYEQFRIGHRRGSSHGASRIFRFSYDDPAYVRMAMAALPLWRELEQELDRTLIETTGGFDAGRRLDEHVAALASCGARYEVITGREAAERFPVLRLAEDEPALFQPDAGIARADDAVRSFADSARAHGAEIREEVPVTALRLSGEKVELIVADGTVRPRVVVVTAGAWARGLLSPIGIELPVTPTRETVAYFALTDGVVPSLVDWREPVFYALADPGRGVKAGLHHAGPVTDPSEEGEVSAAAVATLATRVSERFPTADPHPTGAETCIYTSTVDEHFVIERRGPVVVGSACSGHGFKFAPLTGQRLAVLALEEAG